MRRFWRNRLCLMLGLTLLFGAAASALPDVPYQRWQLLDGTIHANARWIYERIHFDPTPIDVAFVGPSRLTQGVNAVQLGQELAARGLPSHVVNFGLPENGRNINALIVHELLKTRRPKLIVVGVIEKPSRFGHSAYKYIAPAADIVDPGYIGDLNYFSDLIYLPFRQLELFAARFFPDLFGLSLHFDPSQYRGSVVDTTGDVILPDGRIKNGTKPGGLKELHRGVTKLERSNNPPILPDRYRDLEFGDERHFIREIAKEAQAKGVQVAFLSLPYYTGPSTLQEGALYAQFGPIWAANRFSRRSDLYADYGHLTARGASILTNQLVEPVSTLLRKAQ